MNEVRKLLLKWRRKSAMSEGVFEKCVIIVCGFVSQKGFVILNNHNHAQPICQYSLSLHKPRPQHKNIYIESSSAS